MKRWMIETAKRDLDILEEELNLTWSKDAVDNGLIKGLCSLMKLRLFLNHVEEEVEIVD